MPPRCAVIAEVAQVLLDAGARWDRDSSGATPLDDALQFRQMEVVDVLLRFSQALKPGDKLSQTRDQEVPAVLRDAVLRGQTNVVRLLLDRMGPLGSTTLLHDAALKGSRGDHRIAAGARGRREFANAQGATRPARRGAGRAARRRRGAA